MRGRTLQSRVRSWLVVTVIASAAALALATVPAATAANPQVEHLTFGPFMNTNDDFCGTGMTVKDTFTARLTVWDAPNQPVDSRNWSQSEDVFTNPVNGATVIVRTAYGFTDTLVSGDPNGLKTHEWVFKGQAELIRGGDGGVLGRDVGYLVVHVTWNGPEFSGEFISAEIVTDRGGHPGFASDRDCAVMVPALGLS
jgi:hypothetical protein